MALALVLPSPGVTPGITAAGQINTALTAIQNTFNAHDHTGGNGVPLGVAGISIDGDLSFESLGQDYKATDAQAFGFKNQSVSPPGGLMLFIKDPGGAVPPNVPADLWFNNGVVEIQLTSGGGALPSSDGFTDDYDNTVLGLGKAAFYQAIPRYRFTTGNNALSVLSNLSAGQFSVLEAGSVTNVGTTLPTYTDLDIIADPGILTLNYGAVGQKVLVTPVGGAAFEGKIEVLSGTAGAGQLILETKTAGVAPHVFSGGRIYGNDPTGNPRYLEIGNLDWVGPTPPAPFGGNSRITMASHQLTFYTLDPLFPDAQPVLGQISLYSSADVGVYHGSAVAGHAITMGSTFKTVGPVYYNSEVQLSDSSGFYGAPAAQLQIVARRAAAPIPNRIELASAQNIIIGDSTFNGAFAPVDPPSVGVCPQIVLSATDIVSSSTASNQMAAGSSALVMAATTAQIIAGTDASIAGGGNCTATAVGDLLLTNASASGLTGQTLHTSGVTDATGLLFTHTDRTLNFNYNNATPSFPAVGTFTQQGQINLAGPIMSAFTWRRVLGYGGDPATYVPLNHQSFETLYIDSPVAPGSCALDYKLDTLGTNQTSYIEWTVSRTPMLRLDHDTAAVAPARQYSIITKRDIMPEGGPWDIGQGVALSVYKGISAGYSYNSVGAANVPAAMVGQVGTETEIPSTVEDVFCRHGNNAVTSHCQMYAVGLAVTAAPNSPHWNVLSFIHAAPLAYVPDMPSNWQSTWGEYIIYFDQPLHEATTIQVSPAHNAATTPAPGQVAFEVYLPDVKMSATGNYCFVKWWRLDYTSATGNVGPGAGVVSPLITQEQPNSFHFNTIGSTPTPGVL